MGRFEHEGRKKTFVIFGVAGFLGQEAFLYLQNKMSHHNIIGISKKKHPFSSYIIDITYKDQIQKFIQETQIDYVLWYAGKSIPSYSTSNEMMAYTINVAALGHVLDVLDCDTKLLYPSSRHVYLDSVGIYDENSPLSLDGGVYTRHKIEAEQMILDRHSNSLITRNFNILGTNPLPQTFLYDILSQSNHQKLILQNHRQVLDVVDRRDAIRAHIHLLCHSDLKHRIYNISSGRGYEIGYIAEQLINVPKDSIISVSSNIPSSIIGSPKRLLDTNFQFEYQITDTLNWISQWHFG